MPIGAFFGWRMACASLKFGQGSLGGQGIGARHRPLGILFTEDNLEGLEDLAKSALADSAAAIGSLDEGRVETMILAVLESNALLRLHTRHGKGAGVAETVETLSMATLAIASP
jgi:hypothetical protein